MDQVLLDANVIIGARKGDGHCIAVLNDARAVPGRYWVTAEIAAEVGKLPQGIGVWPPAQPVGFNAAKLKAYVSKEYGGAGGTRTPPSKGDHSLVETAAANPRFTVLVTSDKDLEHLYYGLPAESRRFTLMAPSAFTKWISTHRP